MNYKILIVDDEAANLRLLERLFRHQYQVITALSGTEALELLAEHDVSLIVSDQRMPGMTGIEFLKRAAEVRRHTVRIILTGYTDVNALVEAINSGVVYKYVNKPWMNEDLQQTVARALEHHETIKGRHQLRRQNERLANLLRTTQKSFVKVFSEMFALKDAHTLGHCYRVRDYTEGIGYGFNLQPQELEQLSLSAFLHEVAHIKIPNQVLFKTSSLTAEERGLVKQGFERGLEILTHIPHLEDIVPAIRYQHEMYDGNGYPEGLSGERIPFHARIIAVADAFDEMTEPHPFQPAAITHDEAMERLRIAAGKKFDPEIVKAFGEWRTVGQIGYSRRPSPEGAGGQFVSS
jgi:response regulator RpfG family c-di-GMP phosphodiesterase